MKHSLRMKSLFTYECLDDAGKCVHKIPTYLALDKVVLLKYADNNAFEIRLTGGNYLYINAQDAYKLVDDMNNSSPSVVIEEVVVSQPQ